MAQSAPPLVERAVNSIGFVPYEGMRQSLAFALRLSYESEYDETPVSSHEVLESTELTGAIALEHFIFLSKRAVSDYLQGLGLSLSVASVRKTLTAQAYRARFEREPLIVGRTLVLTYAETRHFFGFHSRVKMPKDILAALAESGGDDRS